MWGWSGKLGLMKCAVHNTEATAICIYCGRAICPECTKVSASRRFVCSEECAGALSRTERSAQLILQKSLQNAGASALYLFLCGGLSAAAAAGARFYLASPFLIWFCGGCSVVFVASGIWYLKIARRHGPGE